MDYFIPLKNSTDLCDLRGNVVAGPESLDEGPGGHQGPLDGGRQLLGHLPERLHTVDVLPDAGEVHAVEAVLAVEDLPREICLRISVLFVTNILVFYIN